MAQQEEEGCWFVEVSPSPLDILKYTAFVTDPGAGAISTFTGTTRNSFQSRTVLKLDYEAYVPMAVAKLKVGGNKCISGSSLVGGSFCNLTVVAPFD